MRRSSFRAENYIRVVQLAFAGNMRVLPTDSSVSMMFSARELLIGRNHLALLLVE